MNHLSREELKRYIGDKLEIQQRKDYEHHLDKCDLCIERYMEAVEAFKEELPVIENYDTYTDELMRKITFNDSLHNERIPLEKKWYMKKATHYVLAAVMTFLLMITGVFSQITSIPSEIDLTEQSSFTEDAVNKTTNLIEKVKK
ncbi:hypothetical protein [Pseudalkalibacillus sp. SCS-8]|uniref:hypothetical protein n=1 Tax=Pseudalkalibacillus nanhaiensis TaxID=3115291 RepID=UPI0032DAA04C